LHPDFAVDDVKVDEATVDTCFVVPTQSHQDITIADFVEDGFADQFPVGV
jgi:hypothetical protein